MRTAGRVYRGWMGRGTSNHLTIWLWLFKNWFWGAGEIIAWLFLVDGGIHVPVSLYWWMQGEGGHYRAKWGEGSKAGTMVFKRPHWRAGFWWPATLPLWPTAITGICVTIVDVIVCSNKNSLNDENSISSSTSVQFQRALPSKLQKCMRKKREVIFCRLSQGLFFFLLFFWKILSIN